MFHNRVFMKICDEISWKILLAYKNIFQNSLNGIMLQYGRINKETYFKYRKFSW